MYTRTQARTHSPTHSRPTHTCTHTWTHSLSLNQSIDQSHEPLLTNPANSFKILKSWRSSALGDDSHPYPGLIILIFHRLPSSPDCFTCPINSGLPRENVTFGGFSYRGCAFRTYKIEPRYNTWAATRDLHQCGMCDQQMLRPVPPFKFHILSTDWVFGAQLCDKYRFIPGCLVLLPPYYFINN